MRAAVIGGGSWGTALATVLADKGHEVSLWCFEPDVALDVNTQHRSSRYLPGIDLPPSIRATTDLAAALKGSQMVVAVSPSHVTRAVMAKAAPLLPPNVPIVCATKGIENDTLMTMSEVLEDVLPPERHPYLAFLSGPSFAREVAQRQPTAVVVAAHWARLACDVQQAFAVPTFRVYTSNDVTGVEYGGALKNVIAIAAGVSDGLGYGHNARSALITRGLAEISRLAVRRGANPMTLSGLAGMGDLVLTCTGELSRNRQLGIRLGQGETLDQVLGSMQQVAEGVKTAQATYALGRRLKVEMPLCDAVHATLFEGVTAADAVRQLLARELKPEFE